MARPAMPGPTLAVLLLSFASLMLLVLGAVNERPGILLVGVALGLPAIVMAWSLRAGGLRIRL